MHADVVEVCVLIGEKLRMEGNACWWGRSSKCTRGVFVRMLRGSWRVELIGCCHVKGE